MLFYQVLHMMKYAKTLADDNVFHPLLKCLLGRVVSMATGQYKMTLCQIVTEFILPDLWNVTRLPGNCETPEVFTCTCQSSSDYHLKQQTNHFCTVYILRFGIFWDQVKSVCVSCKRQSTLFLLKQSFLLTVVLRSTMLKEQEKNVSVQLQPSQCCLILHSSYLPQEDIWDL